MKTRAARLLRILGTVELLSTLGHDDDVRRVLAGVDPVEVREAVEELERDPEYVPTRRALVAVGFFPESRRV